MIFQEIQGPTSTEAKIESTLSWTVPRCRHQRMVVLLRRPLLTPSMLDYELSLELSCMEDGTYSTSGRRCCRLEMSGGPWSLDLDTLGCLQSAEACRDSGCLFAVAVRTRQCFYRHKWCKADWRNKQVFKQPPVPERPGGDSHAYIPAVKSNATCFLVTRGTKPYNPRRSKCATQDSTHTFRKASAQSDKRPIRSARIQRPVGAPSTSPRGSTLLQRHLRASRARSPPSPDLRGPAGAPPRAAGPPRLTLPTYSTSFPTL